MISVNLSFDLQARVALAAAKEGLTVSALVRQALVDYLRFRGYDDSMELAYMTKAVEESKAMIEAAKLERIKAEVRAERGE